MFVRNHGSLAPVLAKGYFAPDLGALSVGVEAVFDVAQDGSLTRVQESPRRDTDPPDVRHRVLWRGTSVTAFATVVAPPRPPYARTVRFSAADRVTDLAVFGDRHWERYLGQWVWSVPAPFDTLPLCWERAFGGTAMVPPHRADGGLPHPGGAIPYVLNPTGLGLCLEHMPVPIAGTALPNIENPAALLASPSDVPRPHGITPCPEIFGLRMTEGARPNMPNKWSLAEAAFMSSAPLRALHHAPAALIFETPLAVGTVLALSGHGADPVRTAVPPCPAQAQTRSGRQTTPLEPRVRSVHLDADARQLRVTWSYGRTYHPRRAPQWIELRESYA